MSSAKLFALSALGFQRAANWAVLGSFSLASKELKIFWFFVSMMPLAFIKLLFTVLKAFKISEDTFNANNAVSTKYIRLIIFCRGSAGKAITGYYKFLY